MEISAMLRSLVVVAGILASALPALALDLPARTPGLWEMEITPDLQGLNVPPPPRETARLCIDATVDQLLWRRDLGGEMVDQNLCRGTIGSRNGTFTADFSCSLPQMSMTMQMVISGDFNRAYTMELTSMFQGEGAASAAAGRIHATMAYRYIGPCEADQRPGDFIRHDGTKMHLFGDSTPPDKP
jgi:hypothetical protein